MSAPECAHGDYWYTCPVCQREARGGTPSVPPRYSTKARFESRCPGCGGDVEVEDTLTRRMQDEPFVCGDCAEAD